jgi:hypothetical protein
VEVSYPSFKEEIEVMDKFNIDLENITQVL